ncbi:MAG TPA: hypothetical protein VFP55_03765 [Solirubrobacteraceae bacterium]|nr:hypothetical protein [Solirubrobacteraceae bacterium]
MSGSGVTKMLRGWPSFLTSALVGGAFYLVLIDIIGIPELWTLAASAVTCGVTGLLAREEEWDEATFLPGWLLGSWRLLYQIPQDIALLCGQAIAQLRAPRPVRGVFRATAFALDERPSRRTGQAALVETAGSVSPNSIVIGIDEERGLLLVHQLHRHGGAEDLDVLGLG